MSSQIQVSNIDSKKVFELRKIAKELKICQWYNMNKAELISNIKHKISKSQSSKPKIIELIKCCGLTINGDELEKCKNISDKKYCPEHSHRYRLEKPDDCPICIESISDETEIPLECGHLIHKECLIPTNIHICPMCRQDMKQNEIDYIFGQNHQHYNHYNQNSFIQFDFVQIVNEDISMYNNQEHYFQDHPEEYNFEYENYVYYENENAVSNENNQGINIPVESMELIIQEIEINPSHNSYVVIDSDISYVSQQNLLLFNNYTDRLINETLQTLPRIQNSELITNLFINENTVRLMKICFNVMICIDQEIFELLHRIERVFINKIVEIHNELSSDNNDII
jgi:hypothetical protein